METADFLLGAGADTNDTLPDGTSALVLAILNAHYELANRFLEEGADPNGGDPRGSALHVLAWMRKPGRHYVMSYAQPVPTGQLSTMDLAKSHSRSWRRPKRSSRMGGTDEERIHA